MGSGLLAAVGLSGIWFGNTAKIRKRSVDKRTSGWHFGNVEAGNKRGIQKMR
jgi:hypothetical protein